MEFYTGIHVHPTNTFISSTFTSKIIPVGSSTFHDKVTLKLNVKGLIILLQLIETHTKNW